MLCDLSTPFALAAVVFQFYTYRMNHFGITGFIHNFFSVRVFLTPRVIHRQNEYYSDVQFLTDVPQADTAVKVSTWI